MFIPSMSHTQARYFKLVYANLPNSSIAHLPVFFAVLTSSGNSSWKNTYELLLLGIHYFSAAL